MGPILILDTWIKFVLIAVHSIGYVKKTLNAHIKNVVIVVKSSYLPCHLLHLMSNLCFCANTRLPFTFSRRQFPVKLAYATTINKSQGQSLTKVGIYLPQCVFSHGQLYVAFSRAQDPENVKTFIIPIENKQGPMPSPLNNTYTSNVVYRNVLL